MLYTPTKVTVAADQLEKLKREISNVDKKNSYLSIKIQLKNKQGHPMPEQHTLLLTRGQIASIGKVRANGNRRFKTIRMSRQQVSKNVSHPGGVLGFLASLASRALPALAKGLAAGLLGGAAEQLTGGSGSSGGEGLYLFKRGHCIKVDPVKGNGLYLRSHPSGDGSIGDGLYLNRRSSSGGNGMQAVGDGLILGKNSPFKNVPILGWIL